jgi:hypothetical protein
MFLAKYGHPTPSTFGYFKVAKTVLDINEDRRMVLKESIIASIENTRQKMINSVKEKGIKNKNTIKFSQKLDKLIFEHQSKNQAHT